jgi:septum formation protein
MRPSIQWLIRFIRSPGAGLRVLNRQYRRQTVRMPPARRLVLASGSPARLALLRAAGFAPEVVVSGVDEVAVAGDSSRVEEVPELVERLARAKAEAVAVRPEAEGALVIGCDSLFELDGEVRGKPLSAESAAERIRAQRGRTGVLHTGHCLVDQESGQTVSAVRSTEVTFGPMSDEEVDAYVATGEPLHVAGAFTLDGRAAVFVERIEGDPSNVIGLSLPELRLLLEEIGVPVISLWS